MLCHLPLPPQNETTALESEHPAPHAGLPVQVVFVTGRMRLPLIGLDARKSAKPFRGGTVDATFLAIHEIVLVLHDPTNTAIEAL